MWRLSYIERFYRITEPKKWRKNSSKTFEGTFTCIKLRASIISNWLCVRWKRNAPFSPNRIWVYRFLTDIPFATRVKHICSNRRKHLFFLRRSKCACVPSCSWRFWTRIGSIGREREKDDGKTLHSNSSVLMTWPFYIYCVIWRRSSPHVLIKNCYGTAKEMFTFCFCFCFFLLIYWPNVDWT